MDVSVNIDDECIEQAIMWFTKYIVIEQEGKRVDFYSGYMEAREVFKRELITNKCGRN